MKTEKVFGLAWWQPEQWDRLKEISADRDDLEDTYEQWRKYASKTLVNLQAQGQQIKKVSIDLEALIVWCNEKGQPVTGESRAEYVSYVLRKRNNES